MEAVGATSENAVYGTPKQSRGAGKKGGRTRKGDENKASSSRTKGKDNKKATHRLPMSLQLREPIFSSLLPRRPRLGFRHGRTDSMAPR